MAAGRPGVDLGPAFERYLLEHAPEEQQFSYSLPDTEYRDVVVGLRPVAPS